MRASTAFRRGGFTFTELLVVISVGTMLVGAMLPALNTAQDTMKAAVCLGNMHQWGLGFSLYIADQRDWFPYEGSGANLINSPGSGGFPGNLNAWYNVVPPYLGQPTLVQLYTAGKPPTQLTKSIWSCPSATNQMTGLTFANVDFMYAFNARMDPNNTASSDARFTRSQCVAPATTVLLAENPNGSTSSITGASAAARHSGGGNFVLCDGHAEWIAFTNFCRQGAIGCPAFLNFSDADSSSLGDWKKGVVYHWFPFRGAST